MKIKIKLSELLYFSAFFIWLLFNFIAQTNLVYKYPESCYDSVYCHTSV